MLVLLPYDIPLFCGSQEVRVPLVGVDDLDVVHLLRREVSPGELSRGQKFV